MATKSRPRTGSLQYYPRSRAKKERARFRAFSVTATGKALPVNFFGYKAGMIQVGGKDQRKKTPSAGHDIVLPATVIECPPLRVVGVRALGQQEGRRGSGVLVEVTVEKADRHLLKKLKHFKQPSAKKKKKSENTKAYASMADLEKIKEQVSEIRLLVHTQPALTGFGKKKPDISEVALNGDVSAQVAFAREKLGHELRVSDVFEANKLIDVKAVSKGKGMQGVIKRHNVKIQRHKAKKHRAVGSIGPWSPSVVMWTVARPGQMGYHSRTEFNKKILMVGEKGKPISPLAGFAHYGIVRNDFLVVAGSVPGPAKRCIALRNAIRNHNEKRIQLDEVSFVSSVTKGTAAVEEAPKEMKIEKEKKVKKQVKSVAEELKEAAK